MIKFSMLARPGATRRPGVYLRRWAIAGGVAACGIAGGAIPGSGNHDGAASARSAFADSPAPVRQGGVRGGSASAMSVFGGPAVGQSCLQYPASCYAPGPFRVAYGIQALLDRGIDGRGQTVVVPEVASQPPESSPGVTDIRQDLARFDHHATVVASSGDTGAASDPNFGAAPVKEVSLPASDPLVLAAGGTSLALNPKTGAYSGEIAWNTSGGGFSHLFSRPSYQDGVANVGATRGVPDVAADADPNTGMALALADGRKSYSLFPAGGTSAATPLWAGVIALADQYAGRPLGFVNPGIYWIGHSPMGRQAFHDVTTGDNSVVVVPRLITGYQASPGWDPVTGWGSPNAQVLVPLLAQAVNSNVGG